MRKITMGECGKRMRWRICGHRPLGCPALHSAEKNIGQPALNDQKVKNAAFPRDGNCVSTKRAQTRGTDVDRRGRGCRTMPKIRIPRISYYVRSLSTRGWRNRARATGGRGKIATRPINCSSTRRGCGCECWHHVHETGTDAGLCPKFASNAFLITSHHCQPGNSLKMITKYSAVKSGRGKTAKRPIRENAAPHSPYLRGT